MQKLSPAGHKKIAGSKTTTPLTDSGHMDSDHTDSGHTEMAMQTPYHADQCVQQMLCRLTGTYEPHAPKMDRDPCPDRTGPCDQGREAALAREARSSRRRHKKAAPALSSGCFVLNSDVSLCKD